MSDLPPCLGCIHGWKTAFGSIDLREGREKIYVCRRVIPRCVTRDGDAAGRSCRQASGDGVDPGNARATAEDQHCLL